MTCHDMSAYTDGYWDGQEGRQPVSRNRLYLRGFEAGQGDRRRREKLDALSTPDWVEPN